MCVGLPSEPLLPEDQGVLRIYFDGGKSVIVSGVTRQQIYDCKKRGEPQVTGTKANGTQVDIMVDKITHLMPYPGNTCPHGEM